MTVIDKLNSPASLDYIDMLQGIISRMASNSANCKTWMVTLIAAIVSLTDICLLQKLYLCEGIISLMFILDCYYLGQERRFITIQKDFILIIKDPNKDETETIFNIPNSDFCDQLINTINGMLSFSTLPIYGFSALLIFLLLK